LIIPGESGYDRFTAKLDFKKIGSFLADTKYEHDMDEGSSTD
jgi:hypothetical protein